MHELHQARDFRKNACQTRQRPTLPIRDIECIRRKDAVAVHHPAKSEKPAPHQCPPPTPPAGFAGKPQSASARWTCENSFVPPVPAPRLHQGQPSLRGQATARYHAHQAKNDKGHAPDAWPNGRISTSSIRPRQTRRDHPPANRPLKHADQGTRCQTKAVSSNLQECCARAKNHQETQPTQTNPITRPNWR